MSGTTFCLRWGIVGAGKISSDYCSAMTTLPEGENKVVAVAARSLQGAQEFANKFKIPAAYGSYDELAKDPNVDVVYIGTINPTHLDLTLLMLEAGKHVVCEKPMALSMKQARQMLQKAKEKKLFFMEAVWSRCFPVYDTIRKQIAEGILGDVQVVQVKFCTPIAQVDRIRKRDLGGGCLLDIGVYVIQLACMVFDEMPVKITADGVLNKEGMDEGGCIILKYKNGQMANLTYSGRTHSVENRASIHGSKGSIEIPATFWCPAEIQTPKGKVTNDLPVGTVPYNFTNSGGMRYEIQCIRECIQAGKLQCEKISHRHSEMIMTIMDEVRQQIGVIYDQD